MMEKTIFPINGPIWSLFFEIVANAAFAIIAMSTMVRSIVWMAVVDGIVGLIGSVITYGTIDVGFLLGNWPAGLARVTFSFFAGVLVFLGRERFGRLEGALFPVVLCAIFMVPKLPGILDAVFDLVAVMFVFPIIVGCAARSDSGPVSAKLCGTLGELLTLPPEMPSF